MAVLSSTSPGQLSKYVIATVESINSGRVSTATKTYTLKKGTQNDQAVKAFLQLGIRWQFYTETSTRYCPSNN